MNIPVTMDEKDWQRIIARLAQTDIDIYRRHADRLGYLFVVLRLPG